MERNYAALGRKRASQLGQLTKLQNSVDVFNCETQSISILRTYLKSLVGHHDSHNSIIDQMLDCDEADVEKLNEDIERFQVLYCITYSALEDKIDVMEREMEKNTPTSYANDFRALEHQFDEFQAFHDAYEVDSTSVDNLRKRLFDLDPLHSRYQAAWLKIHAESNEEGKSELVRKRNSFSEAYYDIVGWFSEEIARRAPRYSNPSSSSAIKLPQIDLPRFNGDPDTWVTFRDSFKSIVHNIKTISGSTKFRYLKSCITDKNSPINHLLETDDGYEDAWEAVLDFYDDKRRIIDCHFTGMMTAKRMASETHEELQRLLNEFSLHVTSLSRMQTEEELFQAFVAHLVIFRLDAHTRDLWETENKNNIPLWPDLQKFLKERRKTLSTLPAPRATPKPVTHVKAPTGTGKPSWRSAHNSTTENSVVHPVASTASSASTARKCWMCLGDHRLNQCTNFINLAIPQRLCKVNEWKICSNCFGSHAFDACTSPFKCRSCQQKHHTMLHQEQPAITGHTFQSVIEPLTSCNSSIISRKGVTLLQTAIIKVQDAVGEWHDVRAFLDSGSDSNYVSKHIALALKLPLERTHIVANGLGGTRAAVISQKTKVFIGSKSEKFKEPVEFLITSKVTNPMPSSSIDLHLLGIPDQLVLADPAFNIPNKIDMLIGNEIYGKLMRDGRIELPSGPILMNSIFGWIFTGSAPGTNPEKLEAQCNLSTLGELMQTLQSFYKLEDYRTDQRFYTDEETFCEEFFQQTIRRLKSGRFVITLPLKENLNQLASNFSYALCLFLSNEKRLQKNAQQLNHYVDFMEEYEALGHMTEVDTTKDKPGEVIIYLPHHGVENQESSTTSHRTVFNGSSKTASGLSFNDVQCVGPQIQTDVFTLTIRFRQYTVVIKADIAKMYRQILVAEDQRKLQRIIWRPSPDKPIKVYELNTITYGTASASFQSTRCLMQLAIENDKEFPEAAHELRTSFYVDDLISGASTVPEAIKLSNEIVNIINSAEMKLRKFNSNSPEFLDSIQEEDRETPKENTSVKALGIRWDPAGDKISFNVKPIAHDKITRRIVLSETAKIFDPNGILGPVTFSFKLFMKSVTQLSIPWDSPLPEYEASCWKEIASSFSELNRVQLSRHFLTTKSINIQLHGFCDASNLGYGAAVYVRSQNSKGQRESHLVCSKSRVAPAEYRSTARLELCGAVILSVLMSQVSKALTVKINKKFCWTDSSIVLSWLLKSPAQLQTFVANRVSEIQELSSDIIWRHISGVLNPSDALSRGMKPADIIDNKNWFHGPDFLLLHERDWPETILEVDLQDPLYVSEFKKVNVLTLHVAPEENPFLQLTNNSSHLWVIKKKLALIMRFIFNCRSKKLNMKRRAGKIQISDLIDAETALIRIQQQIHFLDDFKNLQKGKSAARNSPIKNLNPQWDTKQKIIRVGGRINNADFCSEDQKHPIILPNCHLTKLIIRDLHQKNFHAGQKATLGIVRLRFWPLRASSMIRFELRKCVICFRARPKTIQQFMGSLPSTRITPAPAFHHTGVDYCGPFDIKTSSLRNSKMTKSYVALFICMVTKAIHLEVVSDLSTQSFLAAFDRFISTRGLPHSMHSDNGLNFVGARNVLAELFTFLSKSTTQNEILNYFKNQEIEWNFIPPRAPEHGGLWEAGVKSMKYHLHRVAETSNLHFEEFATLTKKIEAILNSRPLTAISDDPNDVSFLTAGHFLIGRPLIAKAERNLEDVNISRLKRWDRVVQMQQHFWRRWSKDYLHQLQIRTKNYKDEIPVSVGQLVLLHLDNVPTMHWPIGRITAIHPGKDGITRVASIRTSKSTYKRPVTKLALLPINDADDQPVAGENVRV